MAMLTVYRRLGMMDIKSSAEGNHGYKRFEVITADTVDNLRIQYATFKMSDQVLAAEITDGGMVIERFDRLANLSGYLDAIRGSARSHYWPVVEAVLEQAVWDYPTHLRRPTPPGPPPPGRPPTPER